MLLTKQHIRHMTSWRMLQAKYLSVILSQLFIDCNDSHKFWVFLKSSLLAICYATLPSSSNRLPSKHIYMYIIFYFAILAVLCVCCDLYSSVVVIRVIILQVWSGYSGLYVSLLMSYTVHLVTALDASYGQLRHHPRTAQTSIGCCRQIYWVQ